MNPAQEQLSELKHGLKNLKNRFRGRLKSITGPQPQRRCVVTAGPSVRYSVEGGVKKHRDWERLVGHDGLASGGRRRKAREGPGGASARVEVQNCGRRGRTCMRKLVRVCSRARVLPCRSVSPDTPLSANRVATPNTSEDRSHERRSRIIHRHNMRSRVTETPRVRACAARVAFVRWPHADGYD